MDAIDEQTRDSLDRIKRTSDWEQIRDNWLIPSLKTIRSDNDDQQDNVLLRQGQGQAQVLKKILEETGAAIV